MPKFYTCEEVAEIYRVKTITVWDWIRKKKLAAVNLGKNYIVSEESLRAFEAERQTIS